VQGALDKQRGGEKRHEHEHVGKRRTDSVCRDDQAASCFMGRLGRKNHCESKRGMSEEHGEAAGGQREGRRGVN